MKPTADVQETSELAALMQPFVNLPVVTPQLMVAVLRWLQGKFEEMEKRAEASPTVKPEWGTVGQIAKIFGMKSARADDYLLAWVAEGKVRVISPTDPLTGKKGHKRYNLADVAACMGVTSCEKEK